MDGDPGMGCCGINCAECPTYVATANHDLALAAATAQEWSLSSGVTHRTEEMRCHGCRSDLLFKHCRVCKIRSCVLAKEISTCGQCADYPTCASIHTFLRYMPKERGYLARSHRQLFHG